MKERVRPLWFIAIPVQVNAELPSQEKSKYRLKK
jgi:hypothetical protein